MLYIGIIATSYCLLSTCLDQFVPFTATSETVKCWRACYSDVTAYRDKDIIQGMQLAF